MADVPRNSPFERDVEQAITALKKGSCLLKYGRRGKPKFCPFRLSADESILIWYAGKHEKKLVLSAVSKIIPGQRTAIFQRYPRPDKEYQSFSLLYKDRSLDLICKDKEEAEIWFVGLKALISCRTHLNRVESKGDRISDSSSSNSNSYKHSPLTLQFDPEDNQPVRLTSENLPVNGFGRAFSDAILHTSHKGSFHLDSVSNTRSSASSADNLNARGSTSENARVSLSSAVSFSSHGSGYEDFDALGDAFIWGESIGDGFLGGGLQKNVFSFDAKFDASLPKALESAVILDVNRIACGSRHAALVTKQGEIFTWGEESGGRLGHTVHVDVSQPKLVNSLSGMNVEYVACGEHHTCAVTLSGDLYTWGDGVHNFGLLGHGSEASHWIPKNVQMGALHVSSISCGPWHTAVVTSSGQLFTFGDGTFGALGHGDRTSINIPREVDALKGLRAISTACGVWHTAALVEMESQSSNSDSFISTRLFTWGDGDKGRLGHGDREHKLVPAHVTSLTEQSICQVACGHDMTVALATSGRVYTMGSTIYGQLGNCKANGKIPTVVDGKLANSFIQEMSCGSHHVAVLTSKNEVYTWGKGTNGQLGHGDHNNRDIPTLIEALTDKQVKSVSCGLNFTAVICLHKWLSSTDQSVCSGCHMPFGFRRKRHNCYNCGQVFCKSCTSRKSVRAALAPNIHKPYRVCDDCYDKLKKILESKIHTLVLKPQNANQSHITQPAEKEMAVSRLSSASSFKGESKHSRQSGKSENNCNSMSLIRTEQSQRGNIRMTKFQNSMTRFPMKIYSASVPGSRVISHSTSPHPGSLISSLPGTISTGLVSADMITDELKKTNDSFREEIALLRLELEGLTHKSQNLESELERKSEELKEALAKAEEENAKCMVAKEVIKSLTSQLKDMAERVPGVHASSHSGSNSFHVSSELKLSLNATRFGRILGMHTRDPYMQISDSLQSNAASSSEEMEWVEHAAAGVYLTVSASAGGPVFLKRVRFSRKRFDEERAGEWWAENRNKLQEKFIFPNDDRFSWAADSPSMKKSSSSE
ncbi:Ultraviolet-B receptor UVR8 [Platanthera zijinensis]|uniref:Ultraviolet-B receptor UVR8 n=1 Tax=Platanthera zijinensis TaxID=2320716 RepID=A0AAP0AZ80_9ASPA